MKSTRYIMIIAFMLFLATRLLSQSIPNACSISISEPDAGETLYSGVNYRIGYNPQGTSGKVRITYSLNGGSSWSTIVSNDPDDGGFTWRPVVNVDGTKTNCYIKVEDENDGSCYDITGPFTIVGSGPGGSCSISITEPDPDETLYSGENFRIAYDPLNTSGKVRITYSLNGGSSWSTIVSNDLDDGGFTWRPVVDVDGTKDNCYIKVEDENDGSCSDITGPFTIVGSGNSCSISITEPDAGETLYSGVNYRIGYNPQGTSGKVRITYSLNGGSSWSTIVSNDPDDGGFTWRPVVDVDGTKDNCYIKVEDENDGSCSDVTGPFTIVGSGTPCSISITEPNGGETLYSGEDFTIRYAHHATSGRVKISYSTDSGNSWQVIVRDNVADGDHTWNVDNVNGTKTNCFIKVEDEIDDECFDISAQPFTIIGKPVDCDITVIAPSGGETLYSGTDYRIRYDSENTSGKVRISYSTDGGNSWLTIVENSTADGDYNWLVPDVSGTKSNCLIKVVDQEKSGCRGISNSAFTIKRDPPTTATIKPLVSSPQSAGSEFWLEVWVEEVENLFGLGFDLDFSHTAVLDVVQPLDDNVVRGSFLGADVLFIPNVDETTGKVSIGISRKSGQAGVDGQGPVARIRFKSLSTTAVGTQITFSCSNVVANDPDGNPIDFATKSAEVKFDNSVVVWPGDTNNDGKVNQADVLPLGLYWGYTGSARVNAVSSWTGQTAVPWSPAAATYADGNGNGVVDQSDVLPIGLNWGSMHSVVPLLPDRLIRLSESGSGDAATIALVIDGDANPGEDFNVEIHVQETDNLFGLSFELRYSPAAELTAGPVEIGDWFGSDVLSYDSTNTGTPDTTKIAIGMTRKAGQGGLNGSGMVARIRLNMAGTAIPGVTSSRFWFEDVLANDPAGGPVLLDTTTVRVVTDVEMVRAMGVLARFELQPNYPNPFNPSTQISYSIADAVMVRIDVFDVLGKHIKTLTHRFHQDGHYSVTWDGHSDRGEAVASGLYIYQLKAGDYVQSRKMLLLR